MAFHRVHVRDLRVGDRLRPTDVTVVVAPQRRINTPSGKVDLVIEHTNGKRKAAQWGGSTLVGIYRDGES